MIDQLIIYLNSSIIMKNSIIIKYNHFEVPKKSATSNGDCT